jgi:hypothetical protein
MEMAMLFRLLILSKIGIVTMVCFSFLFVPFFSSFSVGDEKNGVTSPVSPDDENLEYVLKDRYGFFVTDKYHKYLEISVDLKEQRREKESERTRKWMKMIKKWDFYFKTRFEKIKNRTRKGVFFLPFFPFLSFFSPLPTYLLGIPDSVRGFVWYQYASGETVKAKFPDVRQLQVENLPTIVIEEIERDIDRTFPRHVLFVENNGQGQLSLRKLLRWYAILDPEVGYCQGMGFLAGLFLTYMIEEHAFYTFYSVLTVRQQRILLLFCFFLILFSFLLSLFFRFYPLPCVLSFSVRLL